MEVRRPGLWSIAGLWGLARLRWSMLVAVLAMYAAVSLKPFDWQFPDRIVNGATPLIWGWAFATPGILIADAPFERFASAIEAESLDISLEVRPLSRVQWGPAQILKLWTDHHHTLALAQEGNGLVLSLLGSGVDGRWVERIDNVFEAGLWVTIDVRLRAGRLTVAIDGVPQQSAVLPSGVLGTSDSGIDLVLGNETTCNRPWLGDLRKAVIAGPNAAIDYVRSDRTEAPPMCGGIQAKFIPFGHVHLRDGLLNTLMYLPLGCLMGMMVRRCTWGIFAALLLAIFSMSLTLEMLQLFLPSRFASMNDTFLNTAGGALGLGLTLSLRPRLTAWLSERRV